MSEVVWRKDIEVAPKEVAILFHYMGTNGIEYTSVGCKEGYFGKGDIQIHDWDNDIYVKLSQVIAWANLPEYKENNHERTQKDCGTQGKPKFSKGRCYQH